MQGIEVVKRDVGTSSGFKYSWNLTLCMIRFPVFTHEHKFSPDLCSSAQADCYCLIWHRAGPKSRVHPSGGEGLGAELSQTLQSPHLQQAWHGKKHEASSNLMCRLFRTCWLFDNVQENIKYGSHMDEHVYSCCDIKGLRLQFSACNRAFNPWAERKDPEIQFGSRLSCICIHVLIWSWNLLHLLTAIKEKMLNFTPREQNLMLVDCTVLPSVSLFRFVISTSAWLLPMPVYQQMMW